MDAERPEVPLSVRQKLEKVKEELSNHRQLKKEKKREQEPIR